MRTEDSMLGPGVRAWAGDVRRLLRRVSLPRWWPAVASVVGALVLWELLSVTGVLSANYFPPISEVAVALIEQVATADFWSAVGGTMIGWSIGLGLAAVTAIPIGIALASFRPLYKALRAVIEFLRPIPSVAIIPLAILIYGATMETKVFLVFYACFWPILIQAIYGVLEVDPVARDTARSFGLGRFELLYRVTLPSALPYVATGLRIASAIALILSVTAELVIGVEGLGSSILLAQSGGATAQMYALIAVTGLLGLLVNFGFRGAERRTLHWHSSQRAAESLA